ncbi:Prophage integrase IntA [Alphaproteobacteria bacterium SO-S41]|nr:Prophage integrase IntA [Alphaproteobacteria bacterium SO-S41]
MGSLTALKLKASLAPGRYSDGDGLMLLVKPSGARSWVLRAQADGKRRDFGLGSAGAMTLAEAREKAAAVRKLYRNGGDPVAARRAERDARRSIPTFREAATLLHGELDGSWRNEKHRDQWLSTLTAYAFPALGALRIDQVEAPAIRETLLAIWLAKPVTARRVRQRIGAVLDWAHAQGYRSAEAPLRSVSKGLPKQPKANGHFAALAYTSVPTLMAQLQKEPTMGRLALRFAILTAARSGEVRGAVWSEFDLAKATWTIPGERMKAGRPHTVPLSQQALDVLEQAQTLRTERGGEIVFASPRGGVMSDMTLSKVLRATGEATATVHGFRSSFRDWAAEQTSTANEVLEAALAHTIPNKVEAAYRRTNFLEKRVPLMAAWGAFAAP